MKIFIKFGEKDKLIRSYNLRKFYFGTANQYIDIEKKEMIVGQGDKGEASISFNECKATFIDKLGNSYTPNNTINIRSLIEHASFMPTYCISELDTDIHCYKTENGYKIKPEFINLMKSHFPKANAALVIKNRDKLIKAIRNAFPVVKYGNINYVDIPKEGMTNEFINYCADEVSEKTYQKEFPKAIIAMKTKYYDGMRKFYLINEHNSYKILFIKSPCFKEENEFRFVLPYNRLSNREKGKEYFIKGINNKDMELYSINLLENLTIN